MRRTLLAAGILAGALLAPTVSADPHPYFQDQGALSWCTCLDKARSAAQSSQRLIFVEYGRRECRNCRILVERILPNVKDRLAAACVGLAADCDEPDPRVEAIFRASMPAASMLPFVGILTPDLKWVTGWEGGIGADEVCRHLSTAEGAQRSLKARAAAAAAPAPSAPATAPRGALTVDAATKPGAGIAVGPTAPAKTPSWTAEDASKAVNLLAAARAAAARGEHGTVLSLDADAARLPVRADPTAWKSLVATSSGWCERSLATAVDAARARRCDHAAEVLAGLRRAAPTGPVAAEAERGERAVDLARRIDATPAAERAKMLEVARTTYRGTRWSVLFE
ncbi:MAG: hypothetical protein U1E39_04420 [Planctomycetota bacterium]